MAAAADDSDEDDVPEHAKPFEGIKEEEWDSSSSSSDSD